MQPAGRLRERAVFERRVQGTGSRGNATGDWTLLAHVCCQFETLDGTELELARMKFQQATHRVRIRYPRSWMPTAKDRVIVGDVTLYIGFIFDPDRLKHDLVIIGASSDR